jgi:hypothetical protein
MPAKKTSRCWPGYEPVPGKKPNSEGSCRKKADSKSTPAENKFKADRKKQLDKWQKEHGGARRQAAQHLHGPHGEASSQKGAATKKKATGSKRTTAKKTTARKTTARKSTARKTAAKKTTARKSAARR